MVIISHDRHFLNGVCTHMSDLDYGALKRLTRDDGLISSSTILSSCFRREVACLDLEALAENRETKCLSSFIFASFGIKRY
jgi:hypothetical protein